MERREFLLSKSKLRRGYLDRKLPPIMEDARENCVASMQISDTETILVKTLAKPYVDAGGVHLLVIPDLVSGENLPAIEDLSKPHLEATLSLSLAIGKRILEQENIDEVDVGWHNARYPKTKGDPKPTPASAPLNLHMHAIGFDTTKLPSLEPGYRKKYPELAARIEDPLQKLTEELILGEVVPRVAEHNSDFFTVFEPVTVSGGRTGFKLRRGGKGFDDSELSNIILQINKHSLSFYNQIGTCFFHAENGSFVMQGNEAEYKRFRLLPVDERVNNIQHFIEERSWLSHPSRYMLNFLAKSAKETDDIIEREKRLKQNATVEEISSRFLAYIGLVQSFAFSAKKTVSGPPDWIFRYEPNVFSSEGVVRASAYGFKALARDDREEFSPDEMLIIERSERKVLEKVKNDIPELLLML